MDIRLAAMTLRSIRYWRESRLNQPVTFLASHTHLNRLFDVIERHSNNKPIMIFCVTRRSAIATCKHLANIWKSNGPRDRHWHTPAENIRVSDEDLQSQ